MWETETVPCDWGLATVVSIFKRYRYIMWQPKDILDKFESSVNQTQKEKFEGDLKKEIKKLQRLRDQIKTWLTANEVKDKRPLLEVRKEIEQDMERFKVIEKETKTKAYSKEGLLSTDAKKDPLQKEKEELDDWLKQCISSLNTQMEKYEFEIESLTTNNKKKRLDKDTALAIEEKRQRLENCSFHVEKLETIMRLLDNERLDCAILRSIKDPIDFITQSCDDVSALDYKNMYDDLRLDEIGDSSGITPGAVGNPSENELNGVPISVVSHRGTSDDAGSSTSTHTSASNQTDSSATHPASSTSSNASSSRERRKSDEKLGILNHVSSTSTPLKPSSGASVNTGGTSCKPKSSNLANQTAPPALMSQVVACTPNKSNRSFASYAANGLPSPNETGANKSFTLNTESFLSGSSAETSSRVPKIEGSLKPSDKTSVSSASQSDTQPTPMRANSALEVSVESTSSSVTPTHPVISCTASSLPVLPSSPVPSLSSKTGFSVAVGTPGVSSVVATSQMISNSAPSSTFVPPCIPSVTLPPYAVSAPYAASLGSNLVPSPQDSLALPSTTVSCVQDKNLAGLLANTQNSSGGLSDNPSLNTCVSLDTALASSLVNKLSITTPVATDSMLPLSTMIPNAPPQSHVSIDKQLPTLLTPLHAQAPRVPSCTQMHPRDAAAPFRNRNLDKSKGPQELLLQLQALESGYRRLPHPCDSEKSRMIVCKNLVNGPSYYPREPLPGTDTEEYYMKLDAQTLFFIFYYFEGTKAQYYAAKALKRMSWRFHTKYMMWFQRHEEPKQITDEYESGSYIYYDFKTMSQCKKEEFIFQYSFLEDKDF
ncbi:CCR4-NOT transcription complex subunit 3 [Paragonimus heterotremus]|uniref:CCR4-NOT transcription complex subunit 3 n=1 Tax=Paragonimus heterotremus TaxID=100268 RepID=A0A8J4SW22_9TREM|nr:CCR4-NOT transcription complex subunit 3 [Paragonimus heterotremus]